MDQNIDVSDLSDITIVIPVKDEEKGIGQVLDRLFRIGIPREKILVVDGHSIDRTVEIAKSKGVKVVVQEGKGKAMAIKTALNYIDTLYMLVMDGDCTYPPEAIPKLIEKLKLENADLVIGVRKPISSKAMPKINAFGNKVLTKIFNLLYGTNLRDVLSGMYIVKVKSLQDMFFESRGFGIESEIVAHIASTGGKITEVDIEYYERCDPRGKKLKPIKDGLRIFLDMVRLSWRYNPLFTTLLIAGLLLIPGLIIDLYVGYHYIFHGIKYYVKGLIGAILTAVGVLSGVMASMILYMKRFELRVLRRFRSIEMTLESILQHEKQSSKKSPGDTSV